MEPLILEIATRGLCRYHPVDADVTCIGRALDNDVILSDPTVAAHHLKIIRHHDNSLELVNLAEVNPTRLGRKQIDTLVTGELPLSLELGRVKIRVLPASYEVAATRPLAGEGRPNHLFAHTGWAVVLVICCMALGVVEFYLTTYNSYKWLDLAKYLMRETLLTIGLFVLGLAILERLLVNRWEIKQLLISVSLLFLIYQLLGIAANEFDYLFSSSLPGMLILFGWLVLVIPAAICLYLVHISHLRASRSILLAILIASPIALPSLLQSRELQALLSDFSPSARYQNSLSPLNWHLRKTVSLDEFILQAKKLEAGKFVD